MRKTFLICLSFLILASTNLLGQKPKIGITYSSLGINDVFTFEDLVGVPGYTNDGYYAIGINYLHPLNHWLELETGLEYSKHKITVSPIKLDLVPREENFSLINIPLSVRANFLNYFFVNGGLILGIQASNNSSVDNLTGVGSLLGVGVKYDFNSGLSVFANPYTKVHSLIPFSAKKYHDRLFEGGFRFSLTYQLGAK